MAVPFPIQFKTVLDDNDFELQADAGESFRVYGIRIERSTGDYVTVRIDNTTVGYFRVAAIATPPNFASHLHFPMIDSDRVNILERAIAGRLFRPYPIACGQKLTITGAKQSGAVVQVIYTKHAAGEVRSTDSNGSNSNEYDFIQYGEVGGDLAEGDNELVTCINPGEFPQFPFAEVVPAKHTIKIHGILASDVCRGASSLSNSTATLYLKLIHERAVLADEDSNGILLKGDFLASGYTIGNGQSNIGFDDNADQRPGLMFPTPLVFSAGDDFDIFVVSSANGGAGVIEDGHFIVGLLMTCTRTP